MFTGHKKLTWVIRVGGEGANHYSSGDGSNDIMEVTVAMWIMLIWNMYHFLRQVSSMCWLIGLSGESNHLVLSPHALVSFKWTQTEKWEHVVIFTITQPIGSISNFWDIFWDVSIFSKAQILMYGHLVLWLSQSCAEKMQTYTATWSP